MATLPSPTQVAGDHLLTFELWFKKLDINGTGTIAAAPAAQFLKKSGLNDSTLSKLWDFSDPSGKGFLDRAGFFVALKLIALIQNGKEPNLAFIGTPTPIPNMVGAPPVPPHSKSPGPPTVPAPPTPIQVSPGVWVITPSDRKRYDQIFHSLGPEANKVHGNTARGVMINSKLPTDVLGKIWDLSDMDKDGSLDRVEFSIALHLIYKVLENNPLPVALPQEMITSARTAGIAQGPVPAPLAPPSEALVTAQEPQQPTGPPPLPWVITTADMARYNVMFHNADLDKDGFVSGQEIKGVFLQSGLSQMVLAHIWNLCDMKQSGKLNSEQFALAMWLIQQKITGVDPPAALTSEMIPPSMRPKTQIDTPKAVSKPTYSNPELQVVAEEIEILSADKFKLETEMQQKDAGIRLKNNEIKNLQTELDTLSATLKQLENQKGAAQKRLDDLGEQKKILDDELSSVEEDIITTMKEVQTLREQVEDQEASLKEQEREVMSKQLELQELRTQEVTLETSVSSIKLKLDTVSGTLQATQLHISQARNKIEELQDNEHHMTEVLTAYDSAISVGDASSVSESSLRDVTPTFLDAMYLHVGPQTPPTSGSPQEHPDRNVQENGVASAENAARAKDTSFIGGNDPFASAFGGSNMATDSYSSWDSKPQQVAVNAQNADPFGSAFVEAPATSDPFGEKPFSAASEDRKDDGSTPALPPKKAKQPPPRPAPPKARPAKPPPPQINSNNNPANDAFGSWTNKNNDGFADFANFAQFDNKYSSLSSPWGDETTNGPSEDPFGAPFTAEKASPKTDGLGKQLDESFQSDPFGGDYSPFKDSQAVTAAEEFSWDEEQSAIYDVPPPVQAGMFDDTSDEDNLPSTYDEPSRSKSVIAEPFAKQSLPLRAKTSLGSPGSLDFDPLSQKPAQDFPNWKSNEDILNENFSSSLWEKSTSNNNKSVPQSYPISWDNPPNRTTTKDSFVNFQFADFNSS